MRLKAQITLLITGAVLSPVLLISIASVSSIKQKANADIASYRKDELDKLKLYLKHLVDVAYGAIQFNHRQAQSTIPAAAVDSSATPSPPNAGIEREPMQACLKELAAIRFDRGKDTSG